MHSVAQIHQGLESVFDHCRIAANHKARIGFGKLKADFFFQAAILQQFGNPFAAQCAFRFLTRSDRNKSEFMEIFLNQRMLFQISKALVENQLISIRDGMRQNQTVKTLPNLRRNAGTRAEHNQIFAVGETLGQEETGSRFIQQNSIALFHRSKTRRHRAAFD